MLFSALAHGAEPVLTVRVVDAAGAPVENATVQIAGSSERLPISGGTWTGDTVGGERLGRAERVKVYVSAPGYAATAAEARVAERRGNTLTVVLAARTPVADAAATDAEKAALAAERAWIDAEALRHQNPTPYNWGVAREARATLATAAAAWLATKPTGEDLATARSLCLASAESPERCGAPD